LRDLTSPVAVDAAMDEFDRLGREEFLERYGFRARCYVRSTRGSTTRRRSQRQPRRGLVVINQDAVTPADFVRALDAAGLSTHALELPRASAWPTLREMIERDCRFVVLAENGAGAAPWYQLVFDALTHVTPFMFASRASSPTPRGWRRAAGRAAARTAHRCSSSTTGLTRTRSRGRTTPPP